MQGRVSWRRAKVSLPKLGEAAGSELLSVAAEELGLGRGGVVVGVLSRDIEGSVGPGGVFLGLVKA
jgi:hypothetical protein